MKINVRFYDAADATKAAVELEAVSHSGVHATFEVDEFMFGGEKGAAEALIADIEAAGLAWRDYDY